LENNDIDNNGNSPIILTFDEYDKNARVKGGNAKQLFDSDFSDHKYYLYGYNKDTGVRITNGTELNPQSHTILLVPKLNDELFLRTQGNDVYLRKNLSDEKKGNFKDSNIFKNVGSKPTKLIYGQEYKKVFLVAKKDWNNYKNKPLGATPYFYRRDSSNDKNGNYALDVVFLQHVSN